MTTLADLPNGYFTVPPGKLANAVIWLEMRARPAELPAEPLRLEAAEAVDAVYRTLFAEIATAWLWSQAGEEAERARRNTFVALDDAGRPVGIVELSSQDEPEIEIIYFGLIAAAIGGGLGRRMMAAVLERTWRSADRVWLHTCNFDHPAALRFYQSCGFVPYATGFEIIDDPRLDGRLPRQAAPHVPLIEAKSIRAHARWD